jgi:hypothetical protein
MPTKRKKKSARRRVAAPAKKAPAKILFQVEGKMSTFGGPNDHGMSPSEGLALFEPRDLDDPKYADLFLPAPPPGTSGLGRRLNPDKYYLACRWDYGQTSKEFLRRALVRVENIETRRAVEARPVDWGPNADTGRVADLSPGLAAALKLNTDDIVSITIAAESATPVGPVPPPRPGPALPIRPGHGTTNPNVKPPIKQFVESPNSSARNGAKIDKIVVHCTEASLRSTLDHFQTAGGTNPVSAHYVIDRNGDIYQCVRDSDSAWHCMGTNKDSIGIEHVGSETDPLAPAQANASADLIRWLLAQYDIPRTNVFGHDFTPGYSRPGGTSCPDKLFGAAHSQATVAAWVEANV